MALNVEREVARLQGLTVGKLREEFREAWGYDPRSWNRPHLIRRIAWKLQEREYGGLSVETLARAKEISETAPVRTVVTREFARRVKKATEQTPVKDRDPRLPPVGSTITRRYRGATIEVEVVEGGFRWRGEKFRSLSAVARAVTGSHINGFYFFKLRPEEKP